MELYQEIIFLPATERDTLACLEELNSKEDIIMEQMVEETVLPFRQADMNHNLNSAESKSELSINFVDSSTEFLMQADVIPPRCKTPDFLNRSKVSGALIDLDQKLNPITPTKSDDAEESAESPWTPTANLKMLISAATSEIKNREQQKPVNLFLKEINSKHSCHLPEMERKQKGGKKNRKKRSQEDSGSDDMIEEISGDVHFESNSPGSHSSRKEKSLGLLCHRFLSRFSEFPDTNENAEICLDEVAKELCVERRRIYDIINVLESVEIVSRLAKNKYLWHGKGNLKHTLAKLKALAKQEGFAKQIEMIKEFEVNQETEDLVRKSATPDEQDRKAEACKAICKNFLRDNQKKDKSLGIMSQRFIMLFLLSKPKTVNLDLSAKILIGDPNIDRTENAKFKTKIRRLYDIANILTSLGLIKKVHVTESRGRKPAFTYTGPDIDDIESLSTCSYDTAHRPSSRHSLLDCVRNPHVSSMLSVPKSFTSKPGAHNSMLNGESRDYKSVSMPSQFAKKSFTRHSSLEQICEVAELERNRLYFESSKSQTTSPTRDYLMNSPNQAKPIAKVPAAKCLLTAVNENRNAPIQVKKENPPSGKPGRMVILKAVDSNSSSQAFTLSENQLRGLLRNINSNVTTTVGGKQTSSVKTGSSQKSVRGHFGVGDSQDKNVSRVKICHLNQSQQKNHTSQTSGERQVIIKRLLEENKTEIHPVAKKLKPDEINNSPKMVIVPMKVDNESYVNVVNSDHVSQASSNINVRVMSNLQGNEAIQLVQTLLSEEQRPTQDELNKNDYKEAAECANVLPDKRQVFIETLPQSMFHMSNVGSSLVLLHPNKLEEDQEYEHVSLSSSKSAITSPQHVPSSQQGTKGFCPLISPVFSSSGLSPLPEGSTPFMTLMSPVNSLPTPDMPQIKISGRAKAGYPPSSGSVINLVPLFNVTTTPEEASTQSPARYQQTTPKLMTSTIVVNPSQTISQPKVVQVAISKPSPEMMTTHQEESVFLTPDPGMRQHMNGKPLSTPGQFFHSTPSGLQQQLSKPAVIHGWNSAFQTVGPMSNSIYQGATIVAARKLQLSQDNESL